jgi:hypothetical protein
MTTQSTCCQPATVTPAASTTRTPAVIDVAPPEATQVSVCCGSPADAVTAGACSDPAAKREAVASGATCCG